MIKPDETDPTQWWVQLTSEKSSVHTASSLSLFYYVRFNTYWEAFIALTVDLIHLHFNCHLYAPLYVYEERQREREKYIHISVCFSLCVTYK